MHEIVTILAAAGLTLFVLFVIYGVYTEVKCFRSDMRKLKEQDRGGSDE